MCTARAPSAKMYDMSESRLRIVISPDSFKGTASATEVARALADGWRSVRPGDDILLRPMADGGEGTLESFALAIPGARKMPVTVTGPDDRRVQTHWLLLPPTRDAISGTGVVELASTSGIELLNGDLRPLSAHTFGFGQAIRAAIEHGASRLVLAIGSSASSDGGSGALRALGATLLDANGRPVALGARGLGHVTSIDVDGILRPPRGGALVLTDVTNPLLGDDGAAAVFAPQKGAGRAYVERIERALQNWSEVCVGEPRAPGAGAAGGTGFGLRLWGASFAPGAERVAELIDLDGALEDADLVLTGEGRYDSQTRSDKAPGYVASRATLLGCRTSLVAGTIEGAVQGFDQVLSLANLAGSAEAAMSAPLFWLKKAGAALAARELQRRVPPEKRVDGRKPR